MAEKRGRIWVACGGANKTAQIKEGWKLFPDNDDAGGFWECIDCTNRNKTGCSIRMEEKDGHNQRVKDWNCEHQSGAVVHWFNGLEVSDGDDVADWVLNNLNKKSK